MTLQELEFHLKYKQFVVLEDKANETYKIISNFSGELACSLIEYSIGQAMETLERDWLDEESPLTNFTLHSTFDLPKERYHVGQKVRVREDVEKWSRFYGFNWGDSKKGLWGLEGTIQAQVYSYYTVRINDFFTAIPHEALDPVYEEPQRHLDGCVLHMEGEHMKGVCFIHTPFNKEQWLKVGEDNGMLRDGKVVV